MTGFANKRCYHFSEVISEKTKDEDTSKRGDNVQFDIQEVFIATGGTETQKGGTSHAGAKGRGAR